MGWKVFDGIFSCLQHFNMKHNDKFYWYVKSFIWLPTGKSLYYISTQPFSTICKHHYKIISKGNIHHVWNVMFMVGEQDHGGCLWE